MQLIHQGDILYNWVVPRRSDYTRFGYICWYKCSSGSVYPQPSLSQNIEIWTFVSDYSRSRGTGIVSGLFAGELQKTLRGPPTNNREFRIRHCAYGTVHSLVWVKNNIGMYFVHTWGLLSCSPFHAARIMPNFLPRIYQYLVLLVVHIRFLDFSSNICISLEILYFVYTIRKRLNIYQTDVSSLKYALWSH